jgi:uncharacterized iron-regulated protein
MAVCPLQQNWEVDPWDKCVFLTLLQSKFSNSRVWQWPILQNCKSSSRIHSFQWKTKPGQTTLITKESVSIPHYNTSSFYIRHTPNAEQHLCHSNYDTPTGNLQRTELKNVYRNKNSNRSKTFTHNDIKAVLFNSRISKFSQVAQPVLEANRVQCTAIM